MRNRGNAWRKHVAHLNVRRLTLRKALPRRPCGTKLITGQLTRAAGACRLIRRRRIPARSSVAWSADAHGSSSACKIRTGNLIHFLVESYAGHHKPRCGCYVSAFRYHWQLNVSEERVKIWLDSEIMACIISTCDIPGVAGRHWRSSSVLPAWQPVAPSRRRHLCCRWMFLPPWVGRRAHTYMSTIQDS